MGPPQKKAKSAPLSSGWQPVSNHEWTAFYENWWRKPGTDATNLEKLHRVVTVDLSQRVRSAFEMVDSTGRLFVREEYLRLYDQLCDVEKKGCTGTLILGQPGIGASLHPGLRRGDSELRASGKSYFIIYALLRRMATGQRTLFSTTAEDAFLFDEQGAWEMEKKDITQKHIPRADDNGPPIWSLIDADDGGPLHTRAIACRMVFAVVAASPTGTNGYNKWYEKGAGKVKRIVAGPWNVEELHNLLSHPSLLELPATAREPYRTLEGVETLVRDVGPCPRDIIWYIRDRGAFERRVSDAVRKIATIEDVLRLFLFHEGDPHTNQDSHCLILVQPGDGDTMCVSLKTEKIAAMVMEHLEYPYPRNHSAQSPFLQAAAASKAWETTTLAGRIFEVLAIQATRGQRPALHSHGFHPMHALNSTANFPSRFQHTLTVAPKRVIHVEDGKSTLGAAELHECSVGEPQESSSAIVLAGSWPPGEERSLVQYAALADCALDPTHYYRPQNPGNPNPLFDTFFLHEGQDHVVVWVVQVAVASRSGPGGDGEESGLFSDILDRLCTRVRNKFAQKKVVRKYVLVVPYQPGVAVRWNLSREVEEGSVYVLYLDSFAPFDAIF
ncbi:hypothetical protein C8Q80DRAFT_1213894 [Daedaleopsis nitida]|nr:hypothetical protein C8Q80DRAFT_1213894 [Daedaleopsis nitida]